jgi:hypothetical protein
LISQAKETIRFVNDYIYNTVCAKKKAPANKKAPIFTEVFLGFLQQLFNLFQNQTMYYYTQSVYQMRKT